MNEDAFLSNIARRLGRQRPSTAAPEHTAKGVSDFLRSAAAPDVDAVERFQRELEALGGQVLVVEDGRSLSAALARLLEDLGARKIGVWDGDFVTRYGLNDVFGGYTIVEWSVGGVEAYTDVDVSVSGCAYAVAETGTIVMMSDRRSGRSVAVLPAVHVVILHRSQVLRHVGDVLEHLNARRDALPSSVHFISGPSRSSDIENDQTIGVHGPAAVVAIVLNGK